MRYKTLVFIWGFVVGTMAWTCELKKEPMKERRGTGGRESRKKVGMKEGRRDKREERRLKAEILKLWYWWHSILILFISCYGQVLINLINRA